MAWNTNIPFRVTNRLPGTKQEGFPVYIEAFPIWSNITINFSRAARGFAKASTRLTRNRGIPANCQTLLPPSTYNHTILSHHRTAPRHHIPNRPTTITCNWSSRSRCFARCLVMLSSRRQIRRADDANSATFSSNSVCWFTISACPGRKKHV